MAWDVGKMKKAIEGSPAQGTAPKAKAQKAASTLGGKSGQAVKAINSYNKRLQDALKQVD